MARTVLCFTAKAWLTFFSWVTLVFAVVSGIGLVFIARVNRFLTDLTATIPSAQNDSTAFVVQTKTHHDLIVLLSSTFESGLVGVLVITLMGTTLMIGNKTNSVKLLMLFALESFVGLLVDFVLTVKETIDTTTPPPVTSWQELLITFGGMFANLFILQLVLIRIKEIQVSRMKLKDCEKNVVVFEKKDPAKSDSDTFTTVDLGVKC